MMKRLVILGGLVGCLLVAWIYEENRRANAVRPPSSATNLIMFLEARPQTSKIRTFLQNGQMYVEVLGTPFKSPLSLASGPPAYIFDESGTLVDWAADRGENPSFVNKWGTLSNATFITVEEAKKLVHKTQH